MNAYWAYSTYLTYGLICLGCAVLLYIFSKLKKALLKHSLTYQPLSLKYYLNHSKQSVYKYYWYDIFNLNKVGLKHTQYGMLLHLDLHAYSANLKFFIKNDAISCINNVIKNHSISATQLNAYTQQAIIDVKQASVMQQMLLAYLLPFYAGCCLKHIEGNLHAQQFLQRCNFSFKQLKRTHYKSFLKSHNRPILPLLPFKQANQLLHYYAPIVLQQSSDFIHIQLNQNYSKNHSNDAFKFNLDTFIENLLQNLQKKNFLQTGHIQQLLLQFDYLRFYYKPGYTSLYLLLLNKVNSV
jgi:hypothetical protein